jgi:receptor expression-enhancing protein 5/6
MDQINQKIIALTEHFEEIPALKALGKRTGVPLGQLVLGVLALLFLLVLLGVYPGIIVNFVGILYPAYMSFKAVESKEEDDDKQWLTYWVVFAVYNFADRFVDYIFFWIPFYSAIKLLVLVYMFFPETRGATKFYNIVAQPIFKAYEARIDSFLEAVSEEALKVSSKITEKTVSAASDAYSKRKE